MGLKFLKVLRLDSYKAFVLLNASESSLDGYCPPLNALGRFLFIGVWGWVSDTWRSLIGDICHSLIGLLMSSLTRAGLLMSSLICADV